MRTTILKGLIISFFFAANLRGEERDIFFLSYPRSGTHWALYCLCNILHRELEFKETYALKQMEEVKVISATIQGDILNGNYPEDSWKKIYAAHSIGLFKHTEEEKANAYLIFILRNYREAYKKLLGTYEEIIPRIQKEHSEFQFDRQFPPTASAPYEYFSNIKSYELWNPKKRFLIYYEDLLDQPEKVLADIMRFLHQDPALITSFINQIDRHISDCLTISFRTPEDSFTKGKDHLFHSREMGEEKCQLIDAEVKKFFPEYFEKYLKRYEMVPPQKETTQHHPKTPGKSL